MKTHHLVWKNFELVLGKRTCIMGILNVTPDSFSDGGQFFNSQDAADHGERLFQEGADILDIGGESTRPFSDPLSADEESRRVLPVIEKLAGRISIPISIDTTKSIVAKRALEAGAAIINDVSALRMDPEMAETAAEYSIPVVLMHMKGTPKTMQRSPAYTDLVGEIKTFLLEAVKRAEEKGIKKSNIIIDPGIGFGKSFAHNLILLNRLDEFKDLNAPILVGPSRKAFIRNLLTNSPSEDLDPLLPVVETGTQAAIAVAVLNGAHIVRVHNVKNTRATVKIVDAVKQA